MLNLKVVFNCLTQVSLLFVLVFSLTGCGNKGNLFLESDAEAARELEEATKKLKKKPGSTATPGAPVPPAE